MMEELIVIEPIVAYRYWRIDRHPDGYRLVGIVLDYTWGKGVNLAACAKHTFIYTTPGMCEGTPGFGCSCGFYAYKTVGSAQSMLGSTLRMQSRMYTFMFGEVELTGKVIEHTYGYRGEKAVIKRLMPMHSIHSYISGSSYMLEQMAQYYEAPTVYI